MTAPGTAESRPALAGLTMPPWLWVWLGGYLLAGMPAEISLLHFVIVTYFGHVSLPQATAAGQGLFTVERFSLIFDVLIYAVIVAGAVAAMFPHLRGRWVERRFKLASDDRPIMTEMQRFVDSHDPSIRLRVSIRAGQMARIYPVGWRSARIAVFRPLLALWHRDREAAQAILLHEVAHRRQGDQLIVGVGSPFIWLIRIWAPAYLLLVLIPTTVYLAAGGRALASLVGVFGAVEAVLIPAEILLPVTALWLAELSADQLAAQAIGSGALQGALRATAESRASLVAQAIALLSHPPRRLRLRRAAARPAGTVALVAAWPAALVAWFLILPVATAVLALLPLGFSLSLTDIGLKAAVHTLLAASRPVVIATTVLLLAWPALAAPWERLWSSGPRRGRHQPWWPYLAAASLPVGMLLLSLAPLQASLPGTTQEPPQGLCPQITSWGLGGGLTEDELVSTELSQLMQAGDNKRVMAADARRLDAAIRAALDNPPPGAARSSYTEAMTDYRTAAQDMQTGNIVAASNAMNDAMSSDDKANTLIMGCP